MLYKPINNRVNVGRVFAWNHVATNFSIGNGLQPPAQMTKFSTPHKIHQEDAKSSQKTE